MRVRLASKLTSTKIDNVRDQFATDLMAESEALILVHALTIAIQEEALE